MKLRRPLFSLRTLILWIATLAVGYSMFTAAGIASIYPANRSGERLVWEYVSICESKKDRVQAEFWRQKATAIGLRNRADRPYLMTGLILIGMLSSALGVKFSIFTWCRQREAKQSGWRKVVSASCTTIAAIIGGGTILGGIGYLIAMIFVIFMAG